MDGVLVRGAWVQDPDTGKLVPKEQYTRQVRRYLEGQRLRSELPAPQVMRDIEPFQNVAVDGAYISSRSDKREMMKRHNLVEIGTEKRITKRNAPMSKAPRVRDSIKRSIQELSSR
jgi:hypothetical protein